MSISTIWTSELIQETIVKLRSGMQVDTAPFFEHNIELKNSNLLYKSTIEEVNEFNKCADDIVYFVEKYCRFMTDKGRVTTKMTNYQKKLLKLLTEEEYIESLEDYGPKNRNLIIMQARQSYKCLFGSEIIIVLKDINKQITIPINFLYYFNKNYLTLLEKLKLRLIIFYYKIEKL